jgi:hypothetical protein
MNPTLEVLEHLRHVKLTDGTEAALAAFAEGDPTVPFVDLIKTLAALWLQRRYRSLEVGDEDALMFVLVKDAERTGDVSAANGRALLLAYAWAFVEHKLSLEAGEPETMRAHLRDRIETPLARRPRMELN